MARFTTRPLWVRLGVFAVVLALSGILPAAPALADPDPTTTEPVPTTTAEPPPTTTEPPPSTPSTNEPAPSTTPEPAPTTPSEPAPVPPPAPAVPASPPASPAAARTFDGPTGEVPDLRVTAAFDKPRYLASDQVKLTVTIANAGTVDAPGVTGLDYGDVGFGFDRPWGDLTAPPGVLIKAGETRTLVLTGYLWNAPDHVITVGVNVFSGAGDINPDDNRPQARATLVDATGVFGGTIVTDTNVNRQIDPGEGGLAGVTVTVSGGVPTRTFTATTDAQGKFSFTAVPTGRYTLNLNAPFPWVVNSLTPGWFDLLTIDDTNRLTDVRMLAVHSLSGDAEASLWFDRKSYQVGDPVRVTIVLTNHTDHPITLATTSCANFTYASSLHAGPSWGPLAIGGPGVTIPPRSAAFLSTTRSFTATDIVPAEAANFGQLGASCDFGANGYPPSSQIFGEDHALVPGVTGHRRGEVFQDLNGNGWPDDGEAVAGATVLISDQNTGAVVARPVTGADGWFAVDLPAGPYDARVGGPWKPLFGNSSQEFNVSTSPLDSEDRFPVVPATGQENRLPNLKAFAEFDKPAYNSGDRVKVRISVTNIGDAVAEGVHAFGCGGQAGLSCDNLADFGEFYSIGPGARIAPGETRQIEMPGKVWEREAGVLTFGVTFQMANGDANPFNNTYRTMVPMTATRGKYSGILYGDRNDNGIRDPGEELERIRVSLQGMVPLTTFTQVTDPHGRFEFADIPTGQYFASYDLPAGWTPPDGMVLVDEQDHGDLEIGLHRPLFQLLQTSIAFTRDSYAEGDTAHLTFTLTNNGLTALEGITAFCSGPGNGNEIYSGGPGWVGIGDDGFLRGPAVTLGPGETRSLDVWDTVPTGSRAWGYVSVSCEFGLDHNYPTDRTSTAYAEARVPGATGSAGGRVIYDRGNDGPTDGDGVPNTKVVLLDNVTGEVVARTTTDATGRYLFADLPAFHYEIRVIGPWQFTGPGYPYFNILGGETAPNRYDLYVVPGPDQPDPDAPPDGGLLPQGGITPATATLARALAATGVDALDLLIAALATLAAGAALLLVRRRRARN